VSQFTEKQKRVSPQPIEVALLNEIAERLLALEKLSQAEHPVGAVEPIEKFRITDVRRHMPLVKPWFSVCLSEDSLVLTDCGPRQINEIKSGTIVFTYNNGVLEKKEVLATAVNGKKEMYQLRTSSRSIEATENHPFLVYNKVKARAELKIVICPNCGAKIRSRATNGQTKCGCGKGITFDRNRYRQYCKLERKGLHIQPKLMWKPLKDIKVGDLLVILKQLPEESWMSTGAITKDFMQILGLFLGDGFLRLYKGGAEITFAVYANQAIFTKYSQMIEKVFGVRVHADKHGMHIYSSRLVKQFRSLGFGEHAKNKEVPSWIFKTPNEYKLSLLRGYLDSDGTVDKGGRMVFVSASEKLIKQIRHLAITIGLHVSNIYKTVLKDHSIVNDYGKLYKYRESISWRFMATGNIGSENPIHASRLNAWEKCSKHHGNKYMNKSPDILCEFLAFDRVKSVKMARVSVAYDISVDSSHNYFANGILVHNSVINDDDHNDVFCIVNTEKSFEEHRILPHETYNIALVTAVIKDLLFWCNHGETATVRIVGTR